MVFDFPIFECGINVFEHPTHYSTSKLTYNGSLDTATYLYSPLRDFTGTDTVVFLTGCGYPPDYNSIKTIEYLIHVFEETKINTISNNSFRLFPNPSTAIVYIKSNEDKIYDFIINNLQGQNIVQGEFRKDLSLTLQQGLYIISIMDKTKIIYRQKIIVDE